MDQIGPGISGCVWTHLRRSSRAPAKVAWEGRVQSNESQTKAIAAAPGPSGSRIASRAKGHRLERLAVLDGSGTKNRMLPLGEFPAGAEGHRTTS